MMMPNSVVLVNMTGNPGSRKNCISEEIISGLKRMCPFLSLFVEMIRYLQKQAEISLSLTSEYRLFGNTVHIYNYYYVEDKVEGT